MVTVNPDGSPQVSVVWVGLDGDDIVSGHRGRWQKLWSVERDRRVTISLEGTEASDIRMPHYLVAHGRGRIEDGGAPELIQRLARTYVGPNVTFPPMPDPPPGFVLRVTPERIGGTGPWSER